MIVLDSNVISEMMRETPSPAAMAWLDSQEDQFFVTAISVAEVLYGIARLPEGKRKRRLGEAFAEILSEEFEDSALPFDALTAYDYAEIVSTRESLGRPIDIPDAQIAAICRYYGATLATRNEKDFIATGVTVVNPWKA